MKVYCYGTPSKALPRVALAAVKAAPWMRWPLTVTTALVLLVLGPTAWLLIQAGEIGHAIAGFCGFDSREW